MKKVLFFARYMRLQVNGVKKKMLLILDLQGARLYTNFEQIGPLAYSEALGANLSGITVAGSYCSPEIEQKAREFCYLDNNDLFAEVASDYNSMMSPLSAAYMGEPLNEVQEDKLKSIKNQPNLAHLWWQVSNARTSHLNAQAKRLQELGPTKFKYIFGQVADLSDLVETSAGPSFHYDGKQADGAPDIAS